MAEASRADRARRYDPFVATDRVVVEVAESVDQELVDAWERLLPQLSRSACAVTNLMNHNT